MQETFYDVLDVESDATSEEITRAYRAKVKETHPDVSDDPDADERFRQVKRAKEVLTDDSERERYDRLGHEQYMAAERNPVGADTGREDDDRTGGGTGTGERDRTSASGTGRTGSTGRHRRRRETRTGNPFGWDTGDSTDGTGGAGTDSTADASTGTDPDDWNQSRGGPSAQHGTDRASSGYATRTTYRAEQFDALRVPLTPRSIVQITAMFVLYPVFVAASVFPAFPTTVNLVVGLCTIFIIAYLMSIPEVAIVVFGGWGVLTPLLLVGIPALSLVSLFGIIALVAAWFPLGLAFLTRAALRS